MNSGLSRGASSIATTAALSVAILIAAVGSYIGETISAREASARTESRAPAERQEYVPLSDADGNGTPDWQDELLQGGITARIGGVNGSSSTSTLAAEDPASSIGSKMIGSLVAGYVSLKEDNAYTPERGANLAETIATNVRAPGISIVHTSDELTLTNRVSQGDILGYRGKMREATGPIVDLDAEPEFTLFARFITTGEASWLTKLSDVARKYRVTETNLLAVAVPQTAAEQHLRVVNAVGRFAETLERLVRFANDPLALMALLRTYNEAEREMFLAFDALAKFYVYEVDTN